jgi:hypothetical protein
MGLMDFSSGTKTMTRYAVWGGRGMNYCHGTKTNENVKKPRNNLRREHVCE